jgi:hypothetical protein
VKTTQNLQRSEASNAVLGGGGVLKSFRGLEACNLVTATINILHLKASMGHTLFPKPCIELAAMLRVRESMTQNSGV